MNDLLETLTQQYGGELINSVSQQTGVNRAQAGSLLGTALPILLGAMAKNASQGQGAQDLHKALERDHDGSILDNLSGFLSQNPEAAGEGILKHVLGSRRPVVEQSLSKQTGIDANSVAAILKIAAPIVMGYLGKQQRRGEYQPSDLTDLLNNSTTRFRNQSPQAGGLLDQLLDRDGDGDISDDVTQIGADLLGRFLK